MSGVEQRLLSRFKWGLSADLQQPELETRIAILKNKLYKDGIEIPNDVIEYLAYSISSNIRELEGALNKVFTFSNILGKKIDIELTKSVLTDLLKSSNRRITIDEIQNKVASYFNIKIDDLISSRRIRTFARPRQVAMYLTKKLTTRSLPEIGRKFGGRDHTTVIHAVKKIEELKQNNPKFDEDINLITQMITSV